MAALTRLQTLRAWPIPLAIGIVIGGVELPLVQAQAPVPKAARLLQADLTGAPGKEVIMTIVDAQPGAGFPAHLHYPWSNV
jgi:hypothetical protein